VDGTIDPYSICQGFPSTIRYCITRANGLVDGNRGFQVVRREKYSTNHAYNERHQTSSRFDWRPRTPRSQTLYTGSKRLNPHKTSPRTLVSSVLSSPSEGSVHSFGQRLNPSAECFPRTLVSLSICCELADAVSPLVSTPLYPMGSIHITACRTLQTCAPH
jgi:hypothetical protein